MTPANTKNSYAAKHNALSDKIGRVLVCNARLACRTSTTGNLNLRGHSNEHRARMRDISWTLRRNVQHVYRLLLLYIGVQKPGEWYAVHVVRGDGATEYDGARFKTKYHRLYAKIGYNFVHACARVASNTSSKLFSEFLHSETELCRKLTTTRLNTARKRRI